MINCRFYISYPLEHMASLLFTFKQRFVMYLSNFSLTKFKYRIVIIIKYQFTEIFILKNNHLYWQISACPIDWQTQIKNPTIFTQKILFWSSCTLIIIKYQSKVFHFLKTINSSSVNLRTRAIDLQSHTFFTQRKNIYEPHPL